VHSGLCATLRILLSADYLKNVNTVTLSNMKRTDEGVYFHTHILAQIVFQCVLLCVFTDRGWNDSALSHSVINYMTRGKFYTQRCKTGKPGPLI
jgi:hypothetical protein